ncbi:MAG TPA: peptidoglycan-binding domain-containing protein, partial [Gaiellaceae bacterium]|nr:peptidoglycan-binding domain-containing protein [Gaiellaceae bacterium]
MTSTLDRVRRDLGEAQLWERSLERSRQRREERAHSPRSLVSQALLDLDGPAIRHVGRERVARDLTDLELWEVSQSRARAKRLAAEPGTLPQARMAGATLVVAAVAAALPVSGGAHGRAKSGGAAEVRVELLRVGSRGPAVMRLQKKLGIAADGIFGPHTRAAVRKFQQRHGLLVDGIVGPQTRAALYGRAPEQRIIRAW